MARVIRSGGTKQLETILTGIDNVQGKVGWFESAKYEDGTPVAYVATIQEFGSPKNAIPPRSFMRKTISEKSGEWKALFTSAAKSILAGNETNESAVEKLGLRAAGDVRKTISTLTEPALSEITILLRQHRKDGGTVTGKTVGQAAAAVGKESTRPLSVSTKPLIDSGIMLATLTNTTETK